MTAPPSPTLPHKGGGGVNGYQQPILPAYDMETRRRVLEERFAEARRFLRAKIPWAHQRKKCALWL
jgi:hypothetical protein